MRMKSMTGEEVYINMKETGHSVRIGTDWTEVHPRFQKLAIFLDCVPEFFENYVEEDEVESERPKSVMELIIDAIKGMKADPKDGYFTQEGVPNLKKLSVIVGFGVKREQLMEAMQTIMLETGEQ